MKQREFPRGEIGVMEVRFFYGSTEFIATFFLDHIPACKPDGTPAHFLAGPAWMIENGIDDAKFICAYLNFSFSAAN